MLTCAVNHFCEIITDTREETAAHKLLLKHGSMIGVSMCVCVYASLVVKLDRGSQADVPAVSFLLQTSQVSRKFRESPVY